jgi:hypothetical protein
VRAHVSSGPVRYLDSDVEMAPVADVHELALAIDADEQVRNVLDRLLGSRTGRSAEAVPASALPAVPARAPGARRACSLQPRGSRPR